MTLEDNTTPELDIDAAVGSIAEDLFDREEPLGSEDPETTPEAVATPEPDKAPPPAAGTSAAPTAPAPDSNAVAPPSADDTPPDTWKKDAKEKWATIPPELRAEIRRREADISKFVGESQPAVQVGKNFEKVIAPYLETLQKHNINPWDHTAKLLQAHAALALGSPEQKVAAFSRLAAEAGIDISKLAAGGGEAANNPLFQHIQGLEAKIRQLEQGVTGVTTSVKEARVAELEQEVLKFAKDEEEHPFFYEVSDEITRLLSSGVAKTLDDAYRTAVSANPLTRQRLLERGVAAKMEETAKAQREAAEKAKKAAVVNVRSTGKGRAAPAKESIDDTLREALADIHSRTS
jgi:hypothetical protein